MEASNVRGATPGSIATTIGIGAATATTAGVGFRLLHDKVLHLKPDALARATPGPFLAFGAIGTAVAATNQHGLHFSDRPVLQLAQNAGLGAAIFAALTLASPMFHGTKQPLAVSTLVNGVLGAVAGAAVHTIQRPEVLPG